MMHYYKGENIEEELTKDNIPIECLPNDFLWMHVKGGTKISNVINYAKNELDSGKCRSIVWSGTDAGVAKTISCAEILKRCYDLHQITRICYRKVEEYWNPLNKELDQIVAYRRIPCIHILLSLDEIDPTTLGYQHSKIKTKFYEEESNAKNAIKSSPTSSPPSSLKRYNSIYNKSSSSRRSNRKPQRGKIFISDTDQTMKLIK